MILPYRGDFYDANRLKTTGDLGQVLFTPFDIRDEESIAKAVQYSNVVINLIGRDYETKNFKYNDVHVEGPRRIARYLHLKSLYVCSCKTKYKFDIAYKMYVSYINTHICKYCLIFT